MKILLGVPEYPPYHIGGGGEVFKNLAEGYKKEGYEVVVIYGYYKAKWFEGIKKYTQNGIKFYQVSEIPYPKNLSFLKTVMPIGLINYFRLKKIIKKENFDVAHLHGYGLFFINQIAGILNKVDIKYIFTIHGYPEIQNKIGGIIKKIWELYIKFFMNKTLEKAYKITCVSDFIKNDNRNIYKNKSITIYNGINIYDYKNIENNIDIRVKYKIGEEKIVIFSMGRISEMKGFQEIIKRIGEYEKKLKKKIVYLIAGEDSGYKNELGSIIEKYNYQDKVKFVGYLNLEEKKQFLKQSDIFAIPSLWEPFGLVALEGMIYNKVILTTDIGGLKEILKDYNNKILLDDFYKLSKINIKSFSFNNLETFKWENIVKQYLKLMK